jgi:replicative DNA helicase
MSSTDDDAAPRRPARGSRVPPHDLQAEESLLGAMMLDSEAIATAAGLIRADDFYKPAHAHIFDAIHALYAAGQPVDPVTVADELRRGGLLDVVGGHQALVQVMSSTPATTNAAGYARIIEEHALLRRLIGVAGEIAELGYSMPDDVTKALDRAETLVYDVNQRRVTDTTAKIEELLGLNLDRLEQLYGKGDAITGTPTGYVDLDELLSGLQPNALIIVGARPSMGKALALDTPVATPTGWTTMGDLQVGDQVFDDQGRPCNVTYVSPVQHQRQCYEIEFDDGSKITADADHQWFAYGPLLREAQVVTTQQMVDKGCIVGGQPVWYVPTDRAVRAITPVDSVPVRCITVDSPSHLYLAGETMIPTHNTSFALGMAAHAALYANYPVLIFSLEMGNLELSQRLLCAEARIDSARVRTGRLTEDDWNRISQAIGRLAAAPIWIDDNPNVTVMEIRAKARRLRSQVGNLGMVVVDYLQLMTGRGSAENRQVEVSEMSRGLKILARELECPVVALSQLSRQLEMRADKRPMLADLRESGSIEQDADVVMFIYRDDVYNSDSPDRGQAEIIVAKHRNGPTGVARLAFLAQYTRFANMARVE